MPIYEYRCSDCGFQKECLQKMSDAPLVTCPTCGQDTFNKMLSAPGFQLKGSGWYATDFKGGASTASSASAEGASTPAADSKSADAKPVESKSVESKPADSGAKNSAAPAAHACGSTCTH